MSNDFITVELWSSFQATKYGETVIRADLLPRKGEILSCKCGLFRVLEEIIHDCGYDHRGHAFHQIYLTVMPIDGVIPLPLSCFS